jgi:glycosyltransferase involved in cell wall biosynthesis
VKILVLLPYLRDTSPGQRFRLEQWAGVMERHGASVHFECLESPALKKVLHHPGHVFEKIRAMSQCTLHRALWLARIKRSQWDVIVLHRELLPIGPPLLEWLLARKGIPIVYDFDDAIYLPNVSEANRRLAWLKWPQKTATICRLSTHVNVGNEYLREYALQFNPRVSVVPTTIDTGKYTVKDRVALQSPPVIGWSGSHSTIKHLQWFIPTLQELARVVPFRLRVVGADQFSVPGVDVESIPWTPATEVASMKGFDIGLMPLPDDDWSRGKCGLKALQYMALGVPVVASAVGVNSTIIADGRNGFIAATPAEWIEKIRRLLSDAALRRQFAAEGRRTVEERYSAAVQAPRLLEILEQARSGAGEAIGRPKEKHGEIGCPS